ncbi:hypothetical protein [Thermosyntropha lipolytica]|nr:hypothetical protein [Thermosyntropha lipolytica]
MNINIIVQKKGIIYMGKIKDLPYLFAGYPPHTTLAEFIRLHLN